MQQHVIDKISGMQCDNCIHQMLKQRWSFEMLGWPNLRASDVPPLFFLLAEHHLDIDLFFALPHFCCPHHPSNLSKSKLKRAAKRIQSLSPTQLDAAVISVAALSTNISRKMTWSTNDFQTLLLVTRRPGRAAGRTQNWYRSADPLLQA